MRTEVGLVAVDADAPYALVLGRREGAEAAAAGHLEDDLRALGDLVERELLARRLLDELLGVVLQDLMSGLAALAPAS